MVENHNKILLERLNVTFNVWYMDILGDIYVFALVCEYFLQTEISLDACPDVYKYRLF